jgi:hypothetical protein
MVQIYIICNDKRSEAKCSWVKCSEGLSNRLSDIIRRYIDHMGFAACMAVWFITFFHNLLVTFFKILYVFLLLCTFYYYVTCSFVSLIILIVMYVPFCVFCLIVLFCVLFVCKCVLYYCHRDIGALFD